MKILLFGGGLGNQIFEYAFYIYLKERFTNGKIYGIYNRFWLQEHNGLEINKYFDVVLPPKSFKSNFITALLFLYKKIYPKSKLLDLNQTEFINNDAVFLFAFKFNKKYIPENSNWIRFKDLKLNEKNQMILNQIQQTNSVFIHVRRNDYLSPKYKERFEGCCTLQYYEQAIEIIENRVKKPVFFVFSDDIQWTKNNLKIVRETVYIDWNKGNDSYLDMFLMSHCQNGISANSTFSYWGARLNRKKFNVIYPLKWYNAQSQPDIFLNEWIGI